MEILNAKSAGIEAGKSGIMISTTEYSQNTKHYNVVVKKSGDRYYVKAEQVSWDVFISEVYDPEVVEQFADKNIKTTESFFFGLIKPKRYVKGWCEYKKRKLVEYSSDVLTIKQNIK